MKSSTTTNFRKQLRALSVPTQEVLKQSLRKWTEDPYQDEIQFQRVSQSQPFYSLPVGEDCMIIGMVQSGHLYWFWAGTSTEYETLLQYL